MGDGRTRRIYRSLAGTLVMALVIGMLGCGMPSGNDGSMEPEESVITEVAPTPEDDGESSSEESQAVSEQASSEESSESTSADGGESTPAESTKTRKSVKEPGEPKEYVWDFDDLVNAQWKEQEKKAHPKGSSFVWNYSDRMMECFTEIVENTNLDELSKDDGLYKALYVYRQLRDYKHRDKNVNVSIKTRLDRIDGVQSLEELYDLYADEEYAFYNRLLTTYICMTGQGMNVIAVEPETILNNEEAMSDVQRACMTNCLIRMGYDKKRAKEIMQNALEIDKKVAKYYEELKSTSYIYVSKKLLERKEVPIPIVDILKKLNAIGPNEEYWGFDEEYALYKELYQPENLEALKDHMIVMATYALGMWADKSTTEEILTFALGKLEKDAYSKYMLGILSEVARDLIAQEYDKRYVTDAEIKSETEEMIKEIRVSMRECFDDFPWDFPYDGKDFMEKKLDSIKIYVGQNGDYNDLSDVVLTEDPIDNVMALLCSRTRFERKQLQISLDDRVLVGANMFETNAYYIPRMNSIMVNSAWLSMYSDLKEQELQGDGLQYEETVAWLGNMLAHETGHAYSPDAGYYYNYRGVGDGWMKDREYSHYEDYVNGIVEFFDEMEVEYGYKLDGELISDETFADLMAMGCCLRMLEKKDHPDYDLFFRSYARLEAVNATKDSMKTSVEDCHLPGKIRINLILGQFDEFYDTYDVDPESPYYVAPENRLKGLW